MDEGTDKRSRTFMGKWRGLNPDHRISKSPKPPIERWEAAGAEQNADVIARG
jgi:hypothetical protein